MLIILLNLRLAIKKYCQDYEDELKEDILSFQDWKKLRIIKIKELKAYDKQN